MAELNEDEKALLLKFSTGSPCLPAGGFSQLQVIRGCFHKISLISYQPVDGSTTEEVIEYEGNGAHWN